MDKVIVENTEASLAEEEAAFAAAMASVDAVDTEPAEPVAQTEPVAQVEPTVQEQPQEATPADQEQPKLFAGKTEAEIQAMFDKLHGVEAAMAKLHDKAFGKIGEIQQKFERLQSTTFSPAAKAKLKEQFSELYDLLYDESGDPIPVQAPDQPAAVPPAPAEAAPTPESEGYTLEQQIELRLLKRDHPDWDKVMNSLEWLKFVETLEPTEREMTKSSWDADFMSGQLTKFKTHQEAQQKGKAEEAAKGKSRLAEAATPRSIPRGLATPTIEDDEEAAMAAAFRSP